MSKAKLKIDCIEWNDDAQIMLDIPSRNCGVDDIKRQVVNDLASLFKISLNDEIIGYYVLRVDTLAHGNEGVIIAFACNHQKFDMTALIEPVIAKQFKNCISMRMHTARAGLVKKLNELGWQPQEFVMRKALNV